MPDLYRIIDANLNRAREGLRVIEDIMRFCNNDRALSGRIKILRHKICIKDKSAEKLLSARDSGYDVGKGYASGLEGRRKDVFDIVMINFKRVEESLRVLEEVYKILKPYYAGVFKRLRFDAYRLEKTVCKEIK